MRTTLPENDSPYAVKLFSTIQCPRLSRFSRWGYRFCQWLSPKHRRFIVLSALFSQLTVKKNPSRYEREVLKEAMRFNAAPNACLLPMELSSRIWKNVRPLSIQQDDKRLARRLVARLPLWFNYGDYDQRLHDVMRLIKVCRRLGY